MKNIKHFEHFGFLDWVCYYIENGATLKLATNIANAKMQEMKEKEEKENDKLGKL